MKILITGSNGLLGQKLVAYCEASQIDYIATSLGPNRNPDCPDEAYLSMDITEKKQVRDIFNKVKPTHVVHTAALTNVDKCELEPDQCELINVTATHYLIEESNEVGAYFQFISTDFIFDGGKGNYNEDDEPKPLSEYGMSKLKSEKLVMELCKHGYSIVRTIIVYGLGHNLSRANLIVWAKNALENGEKMNIIDDQYRAPTFADDLAKGCMQIIMKNKEGVFNMSGPETLSIYQIVHRIADHFGYSMNNVSIISSSTLNQPAPRPPKTGFNLSKAKEQVNYSPHTIEETLDLMF